jgi:Phosphoribosylamine-glycine ligase
MGDPECQVILPRLKTDLIKIMINATNDNLKRVNINWSKKKSMTIVLCSKGYPGNYSKNKRIKNLDKIMIKKKDYIFHAGTKLLNEKLFSNGGRVLNVTSTGNNFLKIRKRIISLIKKINWKNGFFRKDIGWKVIDK